MPGYVQALLEHTKDYESPTSFWKWSAYATIAAVMRDNIYRKLGDKYIYPNIYVLLLASSGIHRKGFPVDMGKECIEFVNNTKIISGRTSIQAIIDELGHAETNPKTGKIVKGGSAIMLAGELAAGIVADPQAVAILTDLYDFKLDYRHHLRTAGRFRVEKIVFSMLAASNEEMLKDVYTKSSVTGGLLARTFLVVPNEFRPGSSLLRHTDRTETKKCLEAELKKIAELVGEIHVSEDAIKEFESWYYPFRESYKTKGDRMGVAARIHTGILKIAMILCVNDLEMSIRKEHIEQAIGECINLIPNYNMFSIASGKSTISEAGGIFLPALLAAKDNQISRKAFLYSNWSNVDAETLDKLVITLESSGFIQSLFQGNDTIYILTDKAKETLKSKGVAT